MNKNISQRQRFLLNLEKERKKYIFEKSQKNKNILKNGSQYLNKIPFVINIPLKEGDLRNNKSEFLNNFNLFSNKYNEINPTITKNKTCFFQKNDLIIDYYINNNLSKSNSNFFSFKNKKIYVNKNKDLGNYNQKEKEKENQKIIYNTNSNYKKVTNLRKIKRKLSPKVHLIDEDLNHSNSYKNSFMRKPVVIKFENDFNINNTYNNSKLYKTNTCKNIDNINKNRKFDINCTAKGINAYNFYEKNPLKSELFRNYLDLEKKSFEISIRKMRKNLSCKSINFKKDRNLREIKKSLKTIKNNQSHSKDKTENNKKLKIIKFNDIKNYKKLKFLKNNDFSLYSINTSKNDNQKYINNTQQQKNLYNSNIKEKMQNKRIYFKNKLIFSKEKNNSENINNNMYSNEKIHPKIIELNNAVYKKLNNGKKKCEIITNEHHKKNKTPIIRKKFIEDYNYININTNNNFSSLNLSLRKNKSEKHIKVNKKISVSDIKNKNILPSILEEEEKIRNSNNRIIKISIINFIRILQSIIDKKNSNILKEILKTFALCKFKIKQNRQTLQHNINSKKYVKKIIPNKIKKNKKNIRNLKKNIIQKNSFEVEKQKINILKRKNIKPFEKYDNCLNFVENFKIQLIKIIFRK